MNRTRSPCATRSWRPAASNKRAFTSICIAGWVLSRASTMTIRRLAVSLEGRRWHQSNRNQFNERCRHGWQCPDHRAAAAAAVERVWARRPAGHSHRPGARGNPRMVIPTPPMPVRDREGNGEQSQGRLDPRLRILCVIGCLLATVGGAGWKQKVKKPELTEDRKRAAESAVRDFEKRRDAAQLSAALDRWKQGDAPPLRRLWLRSFRRRPECVDARLRLAEILWSRSDIAAEPHLRAVLKAEPTRAEHHALGLLLDGTGRADEAVSI